MKPKNILLHIVCIAFVCVLICSCHQERMFLVPDVSEHKEISLKNSFIVNSKKLFPDTLHLEDEMVLQLLENKSCIHHLIPIRHEADLIDFTDDTVSRDGNIYQYIPFRSRLNQKVFLLLASDKHVKVYLNNALVYQKRTARRWRQYQDFVPLELKRGKNQLLITYSFAKQKSKKVRLPRLVSSLSARKIHYDLYQYDFMDSFLVPLGHNLNIFHPCYQNEPVDIQIIDRDQSIKFNQQIILDDKYTVDLDNYNQGVYTCKLIFDDYTYSYPFFYGDVNAFYTQCWRNVQDKLSKEQQAKLTGLKYRIEHLQKFKYHLGQRRSYFEIQRSDNGTDWQTLFVGESRNTTLEKGGISLAIGKSPYVRILCRMNSFHTWNGINEVAFYTDKHPVEIKKVTASSHSANHVCEHVLDRDHTTYWESEGDKQWLMFELSPVQDIDEISIAFKEDKGSSFALRKWQRCLVMLLEDLQDVSRTYKEMNLRPKKQIRSYVSEIDSSEQHYIMCTPERKDTVTRRPLIISIPLNVGHHYPFLEGNIVANQDKIEQTSIQANNLGYYLLWLGGRSYGSDITYPFLTELKSVISQVADNYLVDTSQIYLTGSCGAANKALQLMARYPDTYKTGCFFAADITPDNYPFLKNITGSHLYYLHSMQDDHVPYSNFEVFRSQASEAGLKLSADILEGYTHYYYSRECYPTVFSNFPKHSKLTNRKAVDTFSFVCNELKFSTKKWVDVHAIKSYDHLAEVTAGYANNHINLGTKNIESLRIPIRKIPNLNMNQEVTVTLNAEPYLTTQVKPTDTLHITVHPSGKRGGGITKNRRVEGPVNHAYAAHFIVVQGTQGTMPDKEANRKLVESFCEEYHTFYNTSCKVKDDKDITADDIQSSNLVLVGNFETNTFLQRIKEHIPLTFKSNGIQFFDQFVVGDKLSVNMVYPNPLNPQRYIVMYGSYKMQNFAWKLNPFSTGDTDYHFYQNGEDESLTELVKGNFNRFWKL